MNKQRFNYIFWDNDGVLVDTEGYYLQASREALSRIGIQLTDQQFLAISLTAGNSVFDLARAHGITEDIISTHRQWRDERYAEILQEKQIPPLAGVKETLEKLHDNIGMSIVTSSQKKHFEIIHRRTGLLDYFDFYLTREDYKHSKPSAEPYLLALAKSGQKAQDVLVIEDSPRGLTAAKSAGLHCWVIPGAHTSKEDFANADRILSGAEELAELIL